MLRPINLRVTNAGGDIFSRFIIRDVYDGVYDACDGTFRPESPVFTFAGL
jgi:hypothetical protein